MTPSEALMQVLLIVDGGTCGISDGDPDLSMARSSLQEFSIGYSQSLRSSKRLRV